MKCYLKYLINVDSVMNLVGLQTAMVLHVISHMRHLMLQSASRLKLRLLCNSETPIEKFSCIPPPRHLQILNPHVTVSLMTSQAQENILLAPEHPDRVTSFQVDYVSLLDHELLVALDRAFPPLEAPSLSP